MPQYTMPQYTMPQYTMPQYTMRTQVTIHNQPENLKVPSTIKHLQFTLADVSTENISQFFAPTYDCIDEARSKGHGMCALVYVRMGVCAYT